MTGDKCVGVWWHVLFRLKSFESQKPQNRRIIPARKLGDGLKGPGLSCCQNCRRRNLGTVCAAPSSCFFLVGAFECVNFALHTPSNRGQPIPPPLCWLNKQRLASKTTARTALGTHVTCRPKPSRSTCIKQSLGSHHVSVHCMYCTIHSCTLVENVGLVGPLRGHGTRDNCRVTSH